MRRIKPIKDFYKEFEIIKDLGKGSFGIVVKARNLQTGIISAIKVVCKAKMKQRE